MDALWSSVKDLDKILSSDEAAATATLKLLSSAIKPDLPTIVRPDVVRDACALLVAPSEKVGQNCKFKLTKTSTNKKSNSL